MISTESLLLNDAPEIQIFRREQGLSSKSQLQLLRNRLGIASKAWQYRFGHCSDRGVVVCRPRGGLNDTLNQLAKTFIYAYRHQRRFVIDTSRSGLLDDWGRYFELANPCWPIVLNGRHWQPDSGATIEPAALQVCGLDYVPIVDAHYRIRDRDSGQEISFDLNHSHKADVLVHEQYGGGLQGWIALQLFRFTALTRQQVLEAIGRLPSVYTAIHVRHSDVKSNYRQLFVNLRKHLKGKNVLVCTDSAEVQQFAFEALDQAKVVALHPIPQTNGAPLHGNPDVASRGMNVATFADLVALAQADELILSSAIPCQLIWPGRQGSYASGFGSLAADLFSRRYLVRQLLTASK